VQQSVVPTGKNAAQGRTSTWLKSKDLVPQTFEDDQILNVFQKKETKNLVSLSLVKYFSPNSTPKTTVLQKCMQQLFWDCHFSDFFLYLISAYVPYLSNYNLL
jgi:hypothetical protein